MSNNSFAKATLSLLPDEISEPVPEATDTHSISDHLDIGPQKRNDQRLNFSLGVSTITAPLTLESLNLANTRFISGDLVHFPQSLKTLDISNSTLEQAITVSEELLTANPKLKMQHDALVKGLDRLENLETLTVTSKLE